jgi:hypothetical protein
MQMDNYSFLIAAPILSPHKPPCISLYQPTHRYGPENQQDPVRFRNLLKTVEASFQEKYPAHETQALKQPFEALAIDRNFWDNTLSGLAVFCAPGLFRIFKLHRSVREFCVVADRFHVKPLIRILQSTDRYQVHWLNRRQIKLFEGDRDALDEIELAPGVPKTFNEAFGAKLLEPNTSVVASYGIGSGKFAIRHRHGGRKDEVDKDTERYFRAVDRAVYKHHSRLSERPLMLAALKEHHATFRKVSRNPYLMQEGLFINPDAVSLDRLRTEAWKILEPLYQQRLLDLIEKYHGARSRQSGADDVSQVALAAVLGRIDHLLVEADRVIPGRIDPATGRVEPGDISHPEIGDVLDDLAEIVFRMKGHIVVVPNEQMPSTSGCAATYRF